MMYAAAVIKQPRLRPLWECQSLLAFAPKGRRRMGANPHAKAGRLNLQVKLSRPRSHAGAHPHSA
jgi:hypothetical protein